MASAGIRKTPSSRYKVWWRADDDSQGSKTFDTRDQARTFKNDLLASMAQGTWVDPRRSRQLFGDWARQWWETWSSDPDRSPTTLESTEARLRLHVVPYFEHHQLGAITVTHVRRWQNELKASRGRPTVMAARSILYRILQAAEDERVIVANPVRKVPAPKPEVDPDEVFDEAARRALTPEEAGQLLARFPIAWRDHVITLLGTGLRFGEFAGLRRRRVHLDRETPVLQVAPIRYQAGKFGSGFKSRPKSPAAVRPVPLAPQVVEAIRRQLPTGNDPGDLVFTVPGTDRGALSRHLLKHVYQKAAGKLTDPARELPSTVRRVLDALRTEGTLTPDQFAGRFSVPGGRLRPATIAAALDTLKAEGLAHPAIHGDGPMRWSATEVEEPRRFADLDLHGPHDLRHTFATWLEDAGIPSRVIDEVMGHAGGRHLEQGSRMGRVYRETTPEMVARVVAAIEARLAVVLEVADHEVPSDPGVGAFSKTLRRSRDEDSDV
jgi:integrase